ncbi:alpha/beta-hydrolase [Polyplosphaeria fusca]|uniref:Alpha/beta-hydrolase n=1 Tax=Polyplosphaeria fusca TaxID=682080 RepID=A0A9P4V2J4_9PLEO|nr:alpha/beta-hydrolase [Polyplosphaeria fusca]
MSNPLPSACCSRTAIPSTYTPLGTTHTLSSLQVYATGSPTSTRAILFVYDVFGNTPQTLQGADTLAQLTNSLVLMPDVFEGEPLAQDLFPVEGLDDEGKARLGDWLKRKLDFVRAAEQVVEVRRDAEEKFPGVKRWGAFGLCFGGKVTALLAGRGEGLFEAAGTAHPGRLAVDEVKAMKIPYVCLFSKDGEDGTVEEVKEYDEALRKNGHENVIEHFGMQHGWMGARAKLEEEEGKKEFERGYKLVADFFEKRLS